MRCHKSSTVMNCHASMAFSAKINDTSDFSALRAPEILQTFEFRSFFFEKRLHSVQSSSKSETFINDTSDFSALRAPEILQTFEFRSFFFEKRLHSHVCTGPKVMNCHASMTFMTFGPLYHLFTSSGLRLRALRERAL